MRHCDIGIQTSWTVTQPVQFSRSVGTNRSNKEGESQRASENAVAFEYFAHRNTRQHHEVDVDTIAGFLLIHATNCLMTHIPLQLSLLVPSLFSLPKLVSKDEQSQLCVLAFYRCCSSTEKLPLR